MLFDTLRSNINRAVHSTLTDLYCMLSVWWLPRIILKTYFSHTLYSVRPASEADIL